VNGGALVALQAKSDKEQSFALSSQSATERCRRDYLREQRLLVDELNTLLELDYNIPKQMQAEALEVIDKAMDVAEQGPDISQMVFSEADQRCAVEYYVPPHDADAEILKNLQEAEVELGDDVCTRLLVQKVRSMNDEHLKKRAEMREMLDDLAGSDFASDSGPRDIEGKIKLIHSMIIQAQNQGASWTEIGMTVMDCAAKKWAQLVEEGTTDKNLVQETEDVMTDHLREQYQTMTHKQKEYSMKLQHFYSLLAQQEEHAATLMDLKAKAEGAESHVEIKEAEHRRLMAGYQQRHAAREAKREKVQAERREKKKEAREEAKRKYVEMKRELEQAAAAADQEQAANEAQHGDEAVAKQMTKEEKARLQKLEQAVAAFQEKSTTIQKKIEKLTTQAEEAKDLKEKTQERVAKAKKMLEQRKKEAEQAKQEVAKAEEKKKVVVSKAQELTKKKKTFKTQAVERKAPVPPDIEGMLAKLEAEVEKVRGPCEEVCAQEQKLLAKEQKLKLQIETRSEEVKAMRSMQSPSSPASPSKEEHGGSKGKRGDGDPESTVQARLRGEDEGKRLGYRARIAEDPLVPRHVHLYGDLSARREHLAELQQRNAEDEAREILARLPRLTDEEKEELNRHRPQSQVPVWFMRDEDIRVKAALAAQSAVELDRVLQESQERMQVLKKDLERHGRTLAQGFSETAELLVEGPRRYAQAMQPQDEAIRSELLAALELHQECSSRAEDVWRLAEAGCDVGSKENELQMEASACLAHEEDLAEACRAIYKVAKVTKLPEARSFEQYWLRAEKKFKSSALPWQRAMDVAEQLDAERVSKEKLSNLLDLELKRKVLLDAELVAPPEAKRALASLRTLARQELSQFAGTDRMLT